MSQYVSNESMAALLTGIALLLCIGLVAPMEGDMPCRRLLALGLVLGLALLTKVSGLFLVPLVAGATVWGLRRKGWPGRRGA